MTDILYTFAQKQHNHNSNDCSVDINLHHPLAKIVFKAGEGVTLNKVVINKVYSQGYDDYDLSSNHDDSKKF